MRKVCAKLNKLPMLCKIKVWSLMTAFSRMMDSRIRTPGPIETPGPMETFGPNCCEEKNVFVT